MSMEWLAILPFIVVIIFAIWTKQVIPSLFLGVLTAGYLSEPHWLNGLTETLRFVIESLTDPNNLKIIIFLYLFSAVVGIMRMSGGIKGFVETASKKVKGRKSAIFLTWISALGTFSAPSFRIVTIAPVMKAMRKKVNMKKEELGFIIETTASPLIVLIPVATAFVGYMTSVIELSLHQSDTEQDAYGLFLSSIPYNFFAFAMLATGVYFALFHNVKKSIKVQEDSNQEEEDWVDCHPAVAKDLPAKPLNLLLPLASVILSTFFFMYFLGLKSGSRGLEVFLEANVLDAMVLGLLFTAVWLLVYLLRNHKLKTMMENFVDGGNEMMGVIVLLVLVWALSVGSEALNFADIVSSSLSWIPPSFVGGLLFIVGCALSYFIGSSWGTWGILMPVGVSLAQVSGMDLAYVIGAVFASGTFGAFASPLSDDTNTTAGILDLNPMQYAKFKLKPALIAAGIAGVLFFVVPFVLDL
ncbi:Na+/H+ antiporter NhaC family protein [Salinibacillus xinjiangensis]|uniref:Sodium:proton antiporter n=1 Tax=Salinibacillus xinjiangensis TaxID=1229268 RepID=A0A6G1X5I7_9BACI|nr:Na+/H+ antiporter NhaC family protein [Salinibacillus xinjiangensis]MRG86263.1 sodium:proton antiporter [Salinibacillus xinjiangensis]